MFDNNKEFWDAFNSIFKDLSKNLSKYDNVTPENFLNGEYSTSTEEGIDQYGNRYNIETHTSKDGKRTFTRTVVDATPSYNKPSSSDSKDQLNLLKEQLKQAVAKEDFERAATLRDKINKITPQTKTKEMELLIKRTVNEDGTFTDKILTKGMQDFTKEQQNDEIANICNAIADKFKERKTI